VEIVASVPKTFPELYAACDEKVNQSLHLASETVYRNAWRRLHGRRTAQLGNEAAQAGLIRPARRTGRRVRAQLLGFVKGDLAVDLERDDQVEVSAAVHAV
jgi:hypothetical protein